MDMPAKNKRIFNINFIRERHEVTVSPQYNRIYIRKKFAENFRHALDIKIHPENAKELMIEEKPDQKNRRGFSSKKLIRELAGAVGTNEKMHFYFEKEENGKGWRGILLPELKTSYLWENLKMYNQYTHEDDQKLIQCLKYSYRKYIEADEILRCYKIAKCMAESLHTEKSADAAERYIWIYAVALSDQLRRAARRKIAAVSFDRPYNKNSKETFLNSLGREECSYRNLEMEEFLNTLTEREKYVLKNLVRRADAGEQTNGECSFVRKMWKEVCSLREKANAYYEAGVIQSLFVKEN